MITCHNVGGDQNMKCERDCNRLSWFARLLKVDWACSWGCGPICFEGFFFLVNYGYLYSQYEDRVLHSMSMTFLRDAEIVSNRPWNSPKYRVNHKNFVYCGVVGLFLFSRFCFSLLMQFRIGDYIISFNLNYLLFRIF